MRLPADSNPLSLSHVTANQQSPIVSSNAFLQSPNGALVQFRSCFNSSILGLTVVNIVLKIRMIIYQSVVINQYNLYVLPYTTLQFANSPPMSLRTASLLAKVGDSHQYQIYVILFVSLKWFLISLTVFLPSYLFLPPTFTCTSGQSFPQQQSCLRPDCQLDISPTLTYRLGLYCQQRFLRNSILSSEFVGSIAGLIILAILADKLGRKTIIVTTLCFLLIGVLLVTMGAIIYAPQLCLVGLALVGFGGYSLSMVSYSYLSEINSELWRQKSIILTYTCWALGEVAVFFVVEYLREWKWICLFIFITPLFALLACTVPLVETPQFLVEKGRYPQAIEALNKVAKFNGRSKLGYEEVEGLKSADKSEVMSEKGICRSLIKRQILLPLVILSLAQACNNGFYYTAQFSLDEYGYGFGKNMLVIGVLELCSCLVANYFCERMARKTWIIVLMGVAGLSGLATGLLRITGVQSQALPIIELVLLGLGRLLGTASFALFGLISSESFPTVVKSTGMGISEAASNLGNIGAPFVVLLASDLRVKPVLLGGILCLFGSLSMIFIKETRVAPIRQEQIRQSKDKLQSLIESQ